MSNTSRGKSHPRALRHRGGRKPKPEASPSELEAHLGYWLRAVSNHVSHAFKRKVEQHGVTVAEWVVLRALFAPIGRKPSDLASTLGLSRGAISKLVDRLAAKELVMVRSDAHDGRAQLVTLNAQGRRLVPRLAALADKNDAEAFGHLRPKQRASLLAMLKSVVAQLGLRAAPID